MEGRMQLELDEKLEILREEVLQEVMQKYSMEMGMGTGKIWEMFKEFCKKVSPKNFKVGNRI
jgi:hypothetical protein